MKYTRKEIDKAGNILLSSKNVDDVSNAIAKINDWRSLHLIPLDELQTKVKKVLHTNKIPYVLIARRLKRLTSITLKLDLNTNMHLGGMQDIGGLRIVVSDVSDLNDLFCFLQNTRIDNFECRKIYDYVDTPKSSGYRSIHFAYTYTGENEECKGLRIELQIRTRLQHLWATAVETASLASRTSLKSSVGDNGWLSFFKVVSSLFCFKEKMPVMKEHINLSMEQLMRICYFYNKQYQYSNILKALNVSVHFVEEKDKRNSDYYLIYADLINGNVSISTYLKEQEHKAVQKYSEMEENLEEGKTVAVLVAVSKVEELKEAYPSYFLDTSEFIYHVEKVCSNCIKHKFIKEEDYGSK